MSSKLKEIADKQREIQIVKNIYKGNDVYNISHPNALSDGDEKGKGELNNSIGSASDIISRESQMARNQYTKANPYDIGGVI